MMKLCVSLLTFFVIFQFSIAASKHDPVRKYNSVAHVKKSFTPLLSYIFSLAENEVAENEAFFG